MKKALTIWLVALLLAAMGLGCGGEEAMRGKNRDKDMPKPSEKAD